MTRIMYDGVTVSGLPTGAPLYAGYLDGHYANLPELRARFPKARIVEIAVVASTLAGHVLDVERGDATPQQAVGWVRSRRAAGADPTVYCSASDWPSVRAAFSAAGVRQPHFWIADYDGDAILPVGAVAKQFRSTATYDQSIVAGYWPGVDPKPAPAPTTPQPSTEDDMAISTEDLHRIALAVQAYKNPATGPDAWGRLCTVEAAVAEMQAKVNAIAAKLGV